MPRQRSPTSSQRLRASCAATPGSRPARSRCGRWWREGTPGWRTPLSATDGSPLSRCFSLPGTAPRAAAATGGATSPSRPARGHTMWRSGWTPRECRPSTSRGRRGAVPDRALSPSTKKALADAGLDVDAAERVLRTALAEDLGDDGDITSAATVADDAQTMTASYVSRSPGVVAGLPLIAATFDLLVTGDRRGRPLVAAGGGVEPGQPLATVTAPAAALLTAERTSLNLLGRLSGIATITRQWADAVAGTGARVRDTRKTTPGLRDLEKYAVRCGGGVNHRRGLFDAYLVKDNHIAAAGGVGAALTRVEQARASVVESVGAVEVQVEVDDLVQLAEALTHRPPSIL